VAISVDWINKVIFVPQSYLTSLGGGVYELDINQFRLDLKDLEESEGITFQDTHSHNSEVTIGGFTLSRVVEIINGYTITFEDGQYAVNLVGANSNISDVTNVNQVSIRSQNSAGLITVTSGSGVTSQDKEDIITGVWDEAVSSHSTAGSTGLALAMIQAILKNKMTTDPSTGVMTIYDSDGVTPLLTAQLYENVAGTQAYRGQGAERREGLEE